MEREHSELQQHISRTDWWCENLGHWRAAITTAEVGCLFSVLCVCNENISNENNRGLNNNISKFMQNMYELEFFLPNSKNLNKMCDNGN